MTRTPQTAPLSCFASEYDANDEVCQRCPHVRACRDACVNVDGVTLDKVRFDLAPPSDRVIRAMARADGVPAIYAAAYRKVYGLKSKPDRPAPATCEVIAQKARENNCSVDLYCLLTMVVRKSTGEPFYAKMLTGSYAEKAVNVYRDALIDSTHRLDTEVLQQLTGVMVHNRDFTQRFLRAELILGQEVIDNFAFGRQNRNAILDKCFDRLDPIWQAVCTIERPICREARSFRIQFRKHPAIAAQAFLSWQMAMPRAISQVLALRSVSPTDLVSREIVYDNTLRFWAFCGYAFQQINVLGQISRF